MGKQEGASRYVLDDWVNSVKTVVNLRIKKYKFYDQNVPPVLEDSDVQSYLQSVHRDFVLAPADKAANNVIVICKKFYYEVLAKELGVSSTGTSTGNSTYKKCFISEQDIVKKHLSFLSRYNIVPSVKEHSLPGMYWLPKLHKNPFKFRFIAASSKCTTKNLSVLLPRGLEKIQQYLTNRCNIIYKNSGVNAMWILKNSQSLLHSMKDNHIDRYESISTWDFSTLYTTIPHSDLLKRLNKLIKLAFDKNGDASLLVNERNSYFSSENNDKYLSFSCAEFCELLEFLISLIYVKYGDEVFQQILGIPMGTNCAPLLANLYLFSYEYDFMMNLMSSKKLHLCRKFSNSFRYIDDLIALNNPYFGNYIKDIYPKELELKETTESETCCSYLDLFLYKDVDGMLKSKLYDKRDDFNFHIVNYPFLDSNIPKNPAYGVYVSRLVCFARACSDIDDFTSRHDNLVLKLLSQGYKIKVLRKQFSNFFQRHQDIISNYNIQLSSFLKNHLSTVQERSAW